MYIYIYPTIQAHIAHQRGDWARCIGHLSAGVKGFPAADLRNNHPNSNDFYPAW